MIATWPDFLAQLTRLLDGEEISNTLVTPATLQQIISLGERRVYREVRCRWNEKDFSASVVGNRAPIPDDFESASLLHFGLGALQPVSKEFLRDNERLCQVRYFAQTGDSFSFAGAVTDGEALQGTYFCRLPDLSETTLPTNRMFLQETDLFIYACLSAAAPFYDQDKRLPLWESLYTGIRDRLNTAHNRAAYSAGRLQRRVSVPVNYNPSADRSNVFDGGSA